MNSLYLYKKKEFEQLKNKKQKKQRDGATVDCGIAEKKKKGAKPNVGGDTHNVVMNIKK